MPVGSAVGRRILTVWGSVIPPAASPRSLSLISVPLGLAGFLSSSFLGKVVGRWSLILGLQFSKKEFLKNTTAVRSFREPLRTPGSRRDRVWHCQTNLSIPPGVEEVSQDDPWWKGSVADMKTSVARSLRLPQIKSGHIGSAFGSATLPSPVTRGREDPSRTRSSFRSNWKSRPGIPRRVQQV